jgi:hypothetical protein
MADEIITESEIGTLEFRDPETGEIRAVGKPQRRIQEKIDKGLPITVKKPYDMVETDDGRKVPDPNSIAKRGNTLFAYNVDTCRAIIELVCEGKTLREISAMKHMPPVSTIHYWVSKYKAFKHDLSIARKVRGEQFADEAIDVARNSSSMTSRADKLLIDTLKWAAKVNDPEVFGDAVTHKGDAANPITILVDTGIKRKNG